MSPNAEHGSDNRPAREFRSLVKQAINVMRYYQSGQENSIYADR